ncbi:MAG: hypothetical protein K0S78_2837 [Thermomicrobiales bacterium]|jgi:hypothetical protein|nr:hypothetical protein [Thermomicrobiales bacterium]MDF3039310.1 hypothetical protein [Thermomicrobiales bacterium]
MDSHRFDTLTRWLGGSSRRQVLSALAVGLLGRVLNGPGADEAAAACKGFNAKCKRNGNCCADEGLRCVKLGKKKKGKKAKKRCRCKSGTCPQQTPCCVRGNCEELCGDGMGGETCCADCFVRIEGHGVPPVPNSDECCPQDKICGPNPKKLADDRCCSDVEDCVEGECCRTNGTLAAVVCGGKCCAQDACCNGSCCPQGHVCADTGDGFDCVSANRACGVGNPQCFDGEECHGGVCCSDLRVCKDHMMNDICCPAGQYCEQEGSTQACCPINETCNSFKGHRVRR